jgi:hypothetical protein
LQPAAGDIVFKGLARSGVWTEPVMLKAAAELADGR